MLHIGLHRVAIECKAAVDPRTNSFTAQHVLKVLERELVEPLAHTLVRQLVRAIAREGVIDLAGQRYQTMTFKLDLEESWSSLRLGFWLRSSVCYRNSDSPGLPGQVATCAGTTCTDVSR